MHMLVARFIEEYGIMQVLNLKIFEAGMISDIFLL
ncbi:hypothetical protein PITCH_A1100007 [uncultured Desulfobacterium sp.]|uniref:Uncharacterized protein n=1 Tax=uncultured Desulfobacterium sp. TaxID=201089 RepID=A0A445MR27_9BACT|nr:hypothetical protein PITCH_A1100007 [uncultured Desulfobacterium sp.]